MFGSSVTKLVSLPDILMRNIARHLSGLKTDLSKSGWMFLEGQQPLAQWGSYGCSQFTDDTSLLGREFSRLKSTAINYFLQKDQQRYVHDQDGPSSWRTSAEVWFEERWALLMSTYPRHAKHKWIAVWFST